MTEQEEYEYLMLMAQAGSAPEEGPGLIERSRDRLQTAAGDVFETMGAPTPDNPPTLWPPKMLTGPGSYGRYGDPTQTDNLYFPQKLLKAAGGDAIPAVGEVVADAAMTAAKPVLSAVTPKRFKVGDAEYDTGEYMGRVVENVVDSKPARALSNALENWEQASPGTYKTAGEAFNVATAGLMPTKALPGAAALKNKATKDLTNAVLDLKKKRLTAKLAPDDFNPVDKHIGTVEVGKSPMRKKTFKPGDNMQKQIDLAADLPDVDPLQSFQENFDAVSKEVTRLRTNLDDELGSIKYRAKRSYVDDALDEAKARTGQSMVIVGDAETSAQRIMNRLDQLLDENTVNGTIAPKDLLKVRRELDNWIISQKEGIWDGNVTATKVALTELRNTMNDLVAQVAPDVEVAKHLDDMHNLMLARSTFAERSIREAKTAPGRFIQRLEAETGLVPPRTPASVRANIGPVEGAFVGSLALGMKGVETAAGAPARNALVAQRMLADLLRGGTEGTQRALLINALNEEEE